jgi:hypothetical protein
MTAQSDAEHAAPASGYRQPAAGSGRGDRDRRRIPSAGVTGIEVRPVWELRTHAPRAERAARL